MIEKFSLDKIKSTFTENSLGEEFFIPKTHENVKIPEEPYRSELFGFSLFYKGESSLIADLKAYKVIAPSLIMMSPSVIRQWTSKSPEISCYTFFFKKAFLLEHLGNNLIFQKFIFFNPNATNVINISNEEYNILRPSFNDILKANNSNSPYKKDIIRYSMITLLFKILDIYKFHIKESSNKIGKHTAIVNTFKSLVNNHFVRQRSVQFYASKMSITAKHLSKVIKNETGNPPSFWINKAITLEAKALLQNPAFSISDVAYKLEFDDPSNFSKYFKRNAQCSPKTYIESLSF